MAAFDFGGPQRGQDPANRDGAHCLDADDHIVRPEPTVVVQQVPVAVPQPPPPPQIVTAVSLAKVWTEGAISIDKPFDVLKLAKARLRTVRKELKRLKALEAEQTKLMRLLDAAEGKPLAVVRGIDSKRRASK